MKTVLTIAGFDPSSGAGVTADLMVFAAHDLFGTSAITALTVQSTQGVLASHPTDPALLRETLAFLDADLRPSGVKIGMVGCRPNTSIISEYLNIINPSEWSSTAGPVVLDPVLESSSGRELLDADGLAGLRRELLSIVDWVTPNTAELAALTGLPVRSQEQLAAAARTLQEQSSTTRRGRPLGVFAKAGHLEKPDDLLLTPDGAEHWLAGERIETTATHGTGCALSSAFLSRLVLGDSAIDSARKAKEYVAEAMRQAPEIGRGKGPTDLLWPLRSLQNR